MEYLPSYMIPGKITAEQNVNVVNDLNDYIEQGDDLIKNLNWPKFDSSLLRSEQKLKSYEQYRDIVEDVWLSFVELYGRG